jgi:hypothetical protein
MRCQSRHEKAFPFANELLVTFALLHILEDHVPLEHREDLIEGIDVDITARMGAADDHGGDLVENACQASAANKALASWRSAVSNPSVNQP